MSVSKGQVEEDLDGSDGHAIQIVYFDEEDHLYKLDEQKLEKLLLNPKIQNMPVSLISINGAFRKGKSFFMSFLIDYLKNDEKVDWDNENKIIDGFKFKSGTKRQTNGIHIWSRAFIKEREDGKKIAFLLIDTQGLFDTKSTIKESANIFALTILTSSTFIYNLHQQIQEDDLHNLLFFAEYGKFLNETTGGKPFQNLTFLIRDWQNPDEFDYGPNSLYLEEILDESKVNNEGMKQTRHLIKQLFKQTESIFLPYPGKSVASSKDFNGRMGDIDSDFKKAMLSACEYLLNPEKISILKINDTEVTSAQLFVFFEKYTSLFKTTELPEPKNIYIATAEANNLAALNKAKASYTAKMNQALSGLTSYKSQSQLVKIHDRCSKECLILFNSTKKMGDAEFCRKYEDMLLEELNAALIKYVETNELKKSASISSFVGKIFLLVICLFVLKTIFRFIGIKIVAKFIKFCYITLILLAVMVIISKITGEFSEITDEIQVLVDTVVGESLSYLMMGVYKVASQYTTGQNIALQSPVKS